MKKKYCCLSFLIQHLPAIVALPCCWQAGSSFIILLPNPLQEEGIIAWLFAVTALPGHGEVMLKVS